MVLVFTDECCGYAPPGSLVPGWVSTRFFSGAFWGLRESNAKTVPSPEPHNTHKKKGIYDSKFL